MKKTLLVAASLFSAASALTMNEAVKASQILDVQDAPSPQFVLSQVTAGNLVFQGVGTAQYNNSIGTNNSFQVGSSTNLGVNASTSSTPEYGVNSHAKLDLAGTTTLKQVIGTSGATQNQSAEQMAAITHAHQTAETEAQTVADTARNAVVDVTTTTEAVQQATISQDAWKDTNSDTWGEYEAQNLVAVDSNDMSEAEFNAVVGQTGTWSQDGTETKINNNATYQTQGEWTSAHETSYSDTFNSYVASYNETAKEEAWQSAYDSQYETTYTDTYTDTNSAIQSTTSTNNTNGTIKGSFKTIESGSAASASSLASWQDDAASDGSFAASSVYGESFSDYQAANQVQVYDTVAIDSNGKSESEFVTENTFAVNTADQTEAEYLAQNPDATDWQQDGTETKLVGTWAQATSGSTTRQDARTTTENGSVVNVTEFDTSLTIQDKDMWQDAYNSSYSTAYNNSFSNSASGASRVSDSQVEVKGIGSDATVVSMATSTFDVEITNSLANASEAESTATASGSAGANLSTSSFANQSQATTASAFMQAFGGILVEE